ncbi:MAG: hypothetical protein AB7K36_29985, partial [Chloroflexota bacterium]
LLYVPVAYTYFDSAGQFLGRLVTWRPRLPRRRSKQVGTPEAAPEAAHIGKRRRVRTENPLPVAGGAQTAEELALDAPADEDAAEARRPRAGSRTARLARRAHLQESNQRGPSREGHNDESA